MGHRNGWISECGLIKHVIKYLRYDQSTNNRPWYKTKWWLRRFSVINYGCYIIHHSIGSFCSSFTLLCFVLNIDVMGCNILLLNIRLVICNGIIVCQNLTSYDLWHSACKVSSNLVFIYLMHTFSRFVARVVCPEIFLIKNKCCIQGMGHCTCSVRYVSLI